MIGSRSGLDLFWQICAIVGSGLLGIFLLALLPRGVTRQAVQWATGITVVFVLWGTFSRQFGFLPEMWRCEVDPLLVGALGTGLLVVTGIVLSRVFPGKPEEPQSAPRT